MAEKKKLEEQMNQFVSFVLHGEEYGVPILCVQEIIRYETLTRVPQSLPYVDGVLNLRGQVIPVINLRRKFELPEREPDKSTRIVVVEVQGRIMGMVVDEVSEVLQVNMDEIAPPPPMGTHLRTDFISGMAKMQDSLVILLEIDKILTTEESVILEQTAASAGE
ncbi:MAG: chemotaxis protein CheW [Candidatus Omnitrophica bacterium]|nr:chemotaxis protein CheW [Candidatus Omnitrophota bacterium]